MTWLDEYLTMIEDCEKRESRLTEWEQNFVDSVRSQIETKETLTEKQTEILDRIWEKATLYG